MRHIKDGGLTVSLHPAEAPHSAFPVPRGTRVPEYLLSTFIKLQAWETKLFCFKTPRFQSLLPHSILVWDLQSRTNEQMKDQPFPDSSCHRLSQALHSFSQETHLLPSLHISSLLSSTPNTNIQLLFSVSFFQEHLYCLLSMTWVYNDYYMHAVRIINLQNKSWPFNHNSHVEWNCFHSYMGFNTPLWEYWYPP